jgi:hypothetical protein
MKKTFLSRESILQASDIQVEDLEVPEWGGTIRVREMTTAEVEFFSTLTTGRDGSVDTSKMPGVRAKVVSWCLIDEGGKPLLRKEDVDELQKRSNRVLTVVFDKILELSGLGADDAEDEAAADADTEDEDAPKNV